MVAQHVINVGLARVYELETKKGFVRTLEWGDGAELKKVTNKYVEIGTVKHKTQADGTIKPEPASGCCPSREQNILVFDPTRCYTFSTLQKCDLI